jgi:hypothetical protein
MTRRDGVGESLEGDGAADTMLDADGDNTGDAGDGYRGCRQFGTTAAEEARGQSLDQRLAEEEPDLLDDGRRDSGWSDDRRQRRDLAQAVTGGDGSHSRTDPDLLGTESIDPGLAAEEAALHPLRPQTAPPAA